MNSGMNPSTNVAAAIQVAGYESFDLTVSTENGNVRMTMPRATITFTLWGKTADETIDLLCEAMQAVKENS